MKPLYKAMDELSRTKPLRFHMPGNKGRNLFAIEDFFSLDMTELPGLDNLHQAESSIAYSQKQMAECFGAEESFFLVNGSSCGIMAAVMTACSEGDQILCARNSHVSLFKGMALAGARPIYIYPQIIPEHQICGGISPAHVSAAVQQHPKAKAIIITSPTYEGITSSLEEIAVIAHANKMLLIVDEAHGAHFAFSNAFPKTALEQGADIVIQSHHKTLASLGQTAVLHVQGNRVDRDRLRRQLSLLQTTSPSYLLLASLDKNRALLQQQGSALFTKYVHHLTQLREGIKSLPNFLLLGKELIGSNAVADLDIGKLVLFSSNSLSLNNWLREEHQIYTELAAETHILFMTSFADTPQDYQSLLKVLASAGKNHSRHPLHSKGNSMIAPYNPPRAVYAPRQSLQKKTVPLPLKDAAGKISADLLVPYPPGIPAVTPGEEITAEMSAYLLSQLDKSIHILGIHRSEENMPMIQICI